MGLIRTEITLKNACDVSNVERGNGNIKDVRQTTVVALVDTGAGTLVINEEIREKLGLRIESSRRSTLADGAKRHFGMTEPVKILWHNRICNCSALVLPDADEVLLGAIPLEDMDLIVNPASLELVGAHGDDVVCTVK